VWPETCNIAWSEPRLPSQSTVSPEKVVACTAASLYQARSITESFSCLAPLRVISPGTFARVSRFIAAHSSMWVALLDRGTSGGDQSWECALKSPITRVG